VVLTNFARPAQMGSALLDDEPGDRESVMNLLARINKPEYFYQPQQFLRRLIRAWRREPGEVDVVLPWGLRMQVQPGEMHGRSLWHFGIYDLVLSEAIWRLLDRGETAIDVGANIGYVTGLMAARLGPTGSVRAFEPHPKVFTVLASNVERWRRQPIARTTIYEMALSSNNGVGFLKEAENFQRNRGSSRVVVDHSQLQIRMARLDDVCADCGMVGVLKLDVEGHERQVLLGSETLIRAGAVRDIIFEEHSQSFSSAVPSMLASLGYTVFFLTRTLTGPLLARENDRYTAVAYLPPNFLATRDPQRAIARFRAGGWQVLQ
jgi:FkbM family methyltransferase